MVVRFHPTAHYMIKKIPPNSAILLFVIGLGIGLLVTTQFKTPSRRVTNPLAPFLAIEQTRADLIDENSSSKKRVKTLRDELAESQKQLKTRKSTLQALSDSLEELKKEADLTQKVGAGVVVTIDDSRKTGATIDSIIHAADLRDVINTLWVAGAKAISVNDERLAATSSIDSIHNAVLVNNVRMNPPFSVKAIGDPKALEQALEESLALTGLRNRSKNLGLVFHAEKSGEVILEEFSGTFSIVNTKTTN